MRKAAILRALALLASLWAVAANGDLVWPH
jgi:hypothetical protein